VKPVVTRIAVLTRPDGRNEGLATRLRTAGWQVHVWPALSIERIEAGPGDTATVPLPGDFDLAVFVSGNAAALYLAQLEAHGMTAWPASCIPAAVGPATAARLRASGMLAQDCRIVHPASDAPRHDSEALWDCLVARGPVPSRVLIVRGTDGRDWLARRLREHGASVHLHAVYRRVPARWDDGVLAQLAQWAANGSRPAWLLTSGESIDAVRANVAGAASPAWWQGCRFVLTHARLVARLGLSPEPAEQGSGAGPGQSVRICAPTEESIFNAFVSG
jgi:uroporphyrinogen-III synthase